MKKNIFHSTNNPKNCICENPFNSQNKNLSVNIISHNNQAGITGPTGPTGPTGATGATGATGGEVVVRSTTTMDPNKQASVVSTLDGNKTMLDFFIPKGETGPCAVIKSGNAESIDSDKNPEVIVRNENNEYYLDFKIPRGQAGSKGDKGDKGEKGATGEKGAQGDRGLKGDKGEKGDAGIGETIIVEDTETLEPEDEAFVIDDFSNGTHHLTFQIPRGATGTKGDTGEKGEQGEQGIQGPQGIQGEKGDAGEKGEKGDTGPRGFPGEIGISEIITIDGTETVEPNEKASIIDDQDKNIHHLTFYIPRGETGAKGDTGAKGEQGEQGIQGPQGAKGETGDTGPMGPTGVAIIPMGLILSYNNDPNTFPAEGIQIASNGRLPLMRLELDNEGILELDTTEKQLKFQAKVTSVRLGERKTFFSNELMIVVRDDEAQIVETKSNLKMPKHLKFGECCVLKKKRCLKCVKNRYCLLLAMFL